MAASVTGYARGINGVIVDLPRASPSISAADFEFGVSAGGPGAAWAVAPRPATVTRRAGAGAGGADRVTITWADGAIKNAWLRVAVKPSSRTGLAEAEVFSFGNLVGDADGNLRVNALDVAAVKRALGTSSTVTGRFDFNRDGRVNALDLAAVRQTSIGISDRSLWARKGCRQYNLRLRRPTCSRAIPFPPARLPTCPTPTLRERRGMPSTLSTMFCRKTPR